VIKQKESKTAARMRIEGDKLRVGSMELMQFTLDCVRGDRQVDDSQEEEGTQAMDRDDQKLKGLFVSRE
jgi:hypothetical protein